jgi:hypothetical protein
MPKGSKKIMSRSFLQFAYEKKSTKLIAFGKSLVLSVVFGQATWPGVVFYT